MAQQRFWTIGYAPYQVVPGAPVYANKAQAADHARAENRHGEYRGRGCKAVPCDVNGRLIVR